MKSNSLRIHALVVAREGAPLCGPVSVELERSQMLVIRGNNGSGKSTFLRTVAGLLPPLTGSIEKEGGRAPLYLGHKRGLAPELSVYDNVAHWARLCGHPELTFAAMRYFDLTDIADVPLHKLSAGWQQRVALTRLITVQSPLWLLDEPASNLDGQGAQLLQSLMQARLEQGGIIVIATHSDIQGEMIKTIHLNALNDNCKV